MNKNPAVEINGEESQLSKWNVKENSVVRDSSICSLYSSTRVRNADNKLNSDLVLLDSREISKSKPKIPSGVLNIKEEVAKDEMPKINLLNKSPKLFKDPFQIYSV